MHHNDMECEAFEEGVVGKFGMLLKTDVTLTDHRTKNIPEQRRSGATESQSKGVFGVRVNFFVGPGFMSVT